MITIENEYTGILQKLITNQNQHLLLDVANHAASSKALVGFDIETEDSKRHDGLNKFMVIDPTSEAYKSPKKLVFDTNRTVITGFSIYVRGDSENYYVNVAHKDKHNRVDLSVVLQALEIIKSSCTWVIHNYCFERTMCLKTWNFDLGKNYVDTMQMAVSAYNDDEYSIQTFKNSDLRGISKLIPNIKKHFTNCTWDNNFTTEQQDLITQVIAKQSIADHSYNGFVKSMTYGYGLKKAVKSFFNYEQQEFKDCLAGKAHMGLLDSEQVLQYGADDAYWCVRLFDRLCQFMQETNPNLIQVFFEQENPMPYIWSDCWATGWRVNEAAIYERELVERESYVETLRALARVLKKLSFKPEPTPRLVVKQAKWYLGKTLKGFEKARAKIVDFVDAYNDSLSDFEVARLVNGAITEKWEAQEDATVTAKVKATRPNLQHYMVQRVILHDLCDLPFVYNKGEISTDVEARGKLLDVAKLLGESPAQLGKSVELWVKELSRYNKDFRNLDAESQNNIGSVLVNDYDSESVLEIISLLNTLTKIDTRIKLYINPYLYLTDPDTKRMYPIIRSTLNTRRMSCENPNTMQLSKRGESTYVRGFFLPEKDDHVLVSVDWSQVELVLIGEESHDPMFFEAYGSLPYTDLHLGAATSAIQVYYPDFGDETLKELVTSNAQQIAELKAKFPRVFMHPITHQELDAKSAYKFWRGDAGKPSNFGYWYSGSLMTVQEKLGWTLDEMWLGTENYRNTFEVAEHWRLTTIDEARDAGFVWVFDGHRRTRYEATQDWFMTFTAKFDAYQHPAVSTFGQFVAKKIQRRAGNQVVNAKIQGGCATLAKRSIKKLVDEISSPDTQWDAYFKVPIHDELVFSVHHTQAVAFGNRILEVMCSHPDLVKWLKLDGTVSVGLTLEPYHPVKAPFGQIELDEAPVLEGYIPEELAGTKLDKKHRQYVVDYLQQVPKSL
jgi:DNA polymerase I-like protein with 3'-5' exonuclease and polymerase domains